MDGMFEEEGEEQKNDLEERVGQWFRLSESGRMGCGYGVRVGCDLVFDNLHS